MKHAQLFWLIGLGIAACLTCSPKASAQGQTVTDDGLYTLYTYVDTDGSNVYANSWFDEDLGGAASADEFTTLLAQAYWQLSDGSSSTSGSGESFSSAVSPGSSAVVTFNYIMYYSYFYVPEGPPGGGGLMCQGYAEDTCYGFDYPSASASIYVPYPPPLITSLSSYSVPQGSQGTLTLSGSDFVHYNGEYLALYIGRSGSPFTAVGQPLPCTTTCTATFSYDFSGVAAGTYPLTVANNESESDGKLFSIINTSGSGDGASQVMPVDPCAITSDPKAKFTSVVATAATPTAGSLAVAFSGPAFAGVHPTVTYGPFSTRESVAAAIAAIVTKNYAQAGITAKAVGANVIYSGIADLGAVSVSGGSAFGTTTSPTAASTVGAACYALPRLPCLPLWPNYDTTIEYERGKRRETARQHIIRRHIDNQPTGITTVYANLPPGLTLTDDQLFEQVKRYNQRTWLLSPGVNGTYNYTFNLPIDAGRIIGTDASKNNLHSNRFVIDLDTCNVITSYPTLP